MLRDGLTTNLNFTKYLQELSNEELDDLNETGLEEKLKEGNKYYSVDDEWMLELIDPPITRLPSKD